MKFNSHGGVSVFELLFYLPAIVVAALVCRRHGISRSSGWIFTLILCLVRILGAGCQLATYHSVTEGLLEAVVILESIGMSPLLLATLGLLSRSADAATTTSPNVFKVMHFRILQLLVTVGLILCIVGGTSSTSTTGGYQPQTATKAGVILYLITFIALLLMAVLIMRELSNAISQDRRIVWAVMIALPFIFVRLIYSLASVFSHNRHFNLITGSVIIHVFMAILEEMVVISIYLVIGWISEIVTVGNRGSIAGRPWKGGLAAGGEIHSRRRTRRRQGPIHTLINAGVSAAQQRGANKPDSTGV